MAKISIIFFVLVAVACVCAAPNCDENEVYSKCAPDCETQCNRWVGPRCPPKQSNECFRKCICKAGFLRSEYNNRCFEESSPYCGGKYIPQLNWIG